MSFNFNPEILTFDTLDSTNAKAKELGRKGASRWTVVRAHAQTAGRGRVKRVWHSPKGGLYLSVLVSTPDVKRPGDLSIVAGAAVAQTVKQCLPKQLDVSVKWPNDCLIGWKKVAGVLCENLGEELALCVIGIGINVNIPAAELEPFQKNPFSATSFMLENGGGTTDLEVVQSTLLRKLHTLYSLYQDEGFEAVRYIWERNCQLIGKKVELSESGWRAEDSAESKKHEPTIIGTFTGIDETGGIVITNPKGEPRHYNSGEITCFWQ